MKTNFLTFKKYLKRFLTGILFLMIFSATTSTSKAQNPCILNGYDSVTICEYGSVQLIGGCVDASLIETLPGICEVTKIEPQWLRNGAVIGYNYGITANQTGVYTYRIRVEYKNYSLFNLFCTGFNITYFTSPGKFINQLYSPVLYGVSGPTQPVCPGSPVVLVANGDLRNNPNANYHWFQNTCGGTYLGSGISITVYPTVTTTYTVRIQSDCGIRPCEGGISVNVNPLTPPSAATANPTAICPGSSSTLTVHGVSSGSHFIQWFSDPGFTQLVASGQFPVVSPTVTTTYYARYVYSCGFSPSQPSTAVPVTVTVNTLNAYIISQSDVSCHGGNDGELEIGVFTNNSGPVTLEYSLDGGATPQYSNLFTGLTEGVHTVTVINPATGCTTSIAETITEPAQSVSASVTTSTASCFGTGTGTASANASGGTPGYTYEWENAQGLKVSLNNPATGLGAGSYTVIATDDNGCTSTSTVTINELDPINVDLGNDKVVFFGALGFTGCHNLSPTISGATGNLTYDWTSTDPNPSIATASGNTLNICVSADLTYDYTVTVTDENGCTGSATINVIYANIDCSSQQNAGKVTICRIPPGNPSNCQTICVSINAAQAILDLGGYVGPCLPNCAQPAARMTASAPSITSSSKELNVHPNPASSSVHINYVSDTNDAEIILITDLQGRVVEKINISGAFEFSGNVDITNYDNGIYFINIMNNNSVLKTAKLVKAE